MDDLYKEIILDHYQNPNHRGKLIGGSAGWRMAGEVNMSCGDSLKISVKIEEDKIVDAKFDGGGCAISMAAVDMLLDKVIGMKLTDVKKMSGAEIEEMMGVELTPSRKKCAYLGLEVLKKI
jgi:nitrogen fixation NifU-like protein